MKLFARLTLALALAFTAAIDSLARPLPSRPRDTPKVQILEASDYHMVLESFLDGMSLGRISVTDFSSSIGFYAEVPGGDWLYTLAEPPADAGPTRLWVWMSDFSAEFQVSARRGAEPRELLQAYHDRLTSSPALRRLVESAGHVDPAQLPDSFAAPAAAEGLAEIGISESEENRLRRSCRSNALSGVISLGGLGINVGFITASCTAMILPGAAPVAAWFCYLNLMAHPLAAANLTTQCYNAAESCREAGIIR